MKTRRDFLLSAIAIALLAAIVALLASGAWERAEAEQRALPGVATGSHSGTAVAQPLSSTWAVFAQPGRSDQGNPDPPPVTSRIGGIVPVASGAVGTVLLGGTLSYVDAKYGPEYLALPFPRGTVAEICGPGGCVTRRSTDFGPDQRVHPDRVADLSAADFVFVCDAPLSAGLCKGTVELEPPVDPADDAMRLEDRPLPATSTVETP